MCKFKNESMCTVTYDLVRQAMEGEPYPMTLVGDDGRVVEMAVNLGIDSHLEACFIPDRGDRYEWRATKFGRKLHCMVSLESLPVLLRRLYEMGDSPLGDRGADVASSILGTLHINESGELERS